MSAAVLQLALSLILLLGSPARAGLLATELNTVDVSPPPNALVPTTLELIDEDGAPRALAAVMAGRPTLLILADYTCKSLCGPVLGLAAVALEQSGLEPGTDYRMVVIGLDPTDRPADARAMKRAQIGEGTDLVQATSFLTADASGLGQIMAALGYRSAYDLQNARLAHPAVAFVLMRDGRLSRTLSGLALDPSDLRLALVEASQGRAGNLADMVRMLCYSFDPIAGLYSFSIHRLLMLVSFLGAMMLAGAIGLMLRKEMRLKP